MEGKGMYLKEILKGNKVKALVGPIIFVIVISLLYNLFGVTGYLVERIYPECIIDNVAFTSDKINLKEFVLLDEGGLYSTTADPWVQFDFLPNQIIRPRTINIEIKNATNLGEQILVYYVPSYQNDIITLQEGSNYITLNHMCEDDYGIRLDLTAKMNETIEMEQIVFNDNLLLTRAVCSKLQIIGGFILLTLLGLWVKYHMVVSKDENNTPKIKNIILILFTFVVLIPFMIQISWNELVIRTISPSKVIIILLAVLMCFAYQNRVDILVVGLIYSMVHCLIQYLLNDYTLIYYIKYEVFGGPLALNVLFIIVLFLFFQHLLGRYLGDFVFYCIFISYIIANLIKIKYQNALFSFADLSLVREIIGIAEQYVSKEILIIGIVLFMAIIIIGVKNRTKLNQFLKPSISKKAVLPGCIMILFLQGILANQFSSLGIDVSKQYLIDKDRLNTFGFGLYTLMEFSGNQNDGKPDNFEENIVTVLNSERVIENKNDIKPTVILILAESLFEAEKIPNVEFNQKLLANLERYKITNIISPSYGGRTAAAEFEALTGLSNMFFQGDIVPYVSYLNQRGNETGSLAQEFNSNGYTTYAVHANSASYYSRDIVYENMGFSDFISREDMGLNASDYLVDGFVKDSVLIDEILKIEEEQSEPVFIFGASLEGHSPYINKYDNTDIIATSSVYNESVLYELSCLGQSIYNFDQQMGRLITFFEESKKPVLIYVFGDHIPPLIVNEKNGYLDNEWLKYTTPLYAYSNFCEVGISEKYMSLSQIAPEILRKSGIEYRPYYDYIYTLREQYPVIHKAFDVDLENSYIQTYCCIQWDLLFGERVLLK